MGQVLTEFITEMLDMSKYGICEPLWIVEIDGSSKAVKGGAGMVL